MFLNIAKAYISGGKKFPEISGIISFREVKNGVILTAKISGLPQSKNHCKGRFFGLHIHERYFLHRKFKWWVCKFKSSLQP